MGKKYGEQPMRVVFFLLFILTVLSSNAVPDLSRAREAFTVGNQAYEQGNYEEAVKNYKVAVESGPQDPALYYNFANALFRQGKTGHAILYYEKALELKPYDKDIRFNLQFARTRIVDKVPDSESSLIAKVLTRIANSFPLNAGIFSAFLFWAVGFIFVGLALYKPRYKTISWIVASVCLLFFLALTPALTQRILKLETQNNAVVLNDFVEVTSGPGPNFQTLAKIHAGTRFEILEDRGEWLKVMLPNGSGGFVRAKGLGRI